MAPRPNRRQSEHARARSHFLLACVGLDGSISFLNDGWERVLGQSLEGKGARPFHELIPFEREGAELIISMLLDQSCMAPVECCIRGKSGKVRRFLWHRRYEPAEQLMYIAGEEIYGSQANASARTGARQLDAPDTPLLDERRQSV
jgi:PAS domain-containing protein